MDVIVNVGRKVREGKLKLQSSETNFAGDRANSVLQWEILCNNVVPDNAVITLDMLYSI